jgi:hypothetical protein
MSALTTTQREAKDLVESLKKQLKKAEALEAVEEFAEKLNSLSGENCEVGNLGPTVFTKVFDNAKTLVDTGSPATIISMRRKINLESNGRLTL